MTALETISAEVFGMEIILYSVWEIIQLKQGKLRYLSVLEEPGLKP